MIVDLWRNAYKQPKIHSELNIPKCISEYLYITVCTRSLFFANLITYVCVVNVFCIEMQAGKLAKDKGWAINIGGGFHHCCSNMGGRFCVYADISLCVKVIQKHALCIRILCKT